MNFIKSLINAGSKDLDKDLAQVVVVSNIICLVVGIFLILPLTIYQFITEPESATVTAAVVIIIAIAYLLNRSGFHVIGRWISGLLLFAIFIANTGTMLPPEEDVPFSFSIFLYGLGLIPFIVFTFKERISLIISLGITSLGIFFYEDICNWIPNSDLPFNRNPVFSRLFVAFGEIFGYGSVALLVYLAALRNKESLKALAILQGKEVEMEKQKEELTKTLEEIDLNKKEEEKRTWANDGMVQFGQIMRNNTGQDLYSKLICGLVEYMDAKLGGIYEVVNEGGEEFITMRAAYAYDREKFLEADKIIPGEGLIGQCFLEAKKIYMTNVPQGFPKIKSGLGDETPNAVLIVPLMNEDKVEGVIEFAGFRTYAPHEIEFIEKLGETIATTINREKVNSRTNLLLEESREQSEVMQQQEEEMRQNMEEMQATQDMMDQKENELLDEIKDLKKQIRDLQASKEE